MPVDIVTLGETMLRFTPAGWGRFEHAGAIETHVGGSESNTAVGLARLGNRVAWLSRLTRNPLGAMIANTLRAHGVDISRVTWTDEDRIGIYYMERGQPPRESHLIYDRQNSAASRMTADDLPLDLFQPGAARLFHTSGITLGISQTSSATALHAAKLAKEAGMLLSFDLNYRARLWSAEEAKHGCDELLQLADFIFLPQRDARTVCQVHLPDPEQTLEELCLAYPRATIVLTLGQQGAAARDARGQYWYQPAYAAEQIERLGRGDAFSAGFLSGYLQTGQVAQALQWGTATAAIKMTVPGDLPLIDRSQVEKLLAGESSQGIAR
ncbi:MAG: sugar kinase [Planctomycetales bacterium]|nr:sugar kinase [Planctomycetales bacterium]